MYRNRGFLLYPRDDLNPALNPEGGTPTGDSGGGGGTPPKLDEPKFSQRDYNRFEQRIKGEYRQKREEDEALIKLGREAQEAIDAKRPLEERVATVTGENATVSKENADLKSENLRMKLAGKAGLHPDLWDRVRGNDEDSINADIETLKKFSPAPAAGGTPPPAPPRGPAPNPQQGTPSPNPNATGSFAAGRDLHQRTHGTKQPAS